MKMRPPMTPLLIIDPYVSVWGRVKETEGWLRTSQLNNEAPRHWTNARNSMLGLVTVDGETWRFLGRNGDNTMVEESVEMNALTTTAVYTGGGIRLTVKYTSPLLAEDLYLSSRPVCYLWLGVESIDGKEHTVTAKLSASEELVLNKAGESRAVSEPVEIAGLTAVRMGNGTQPILGRSGDDLRIDWGYLYLGVQGEGKVGNEVFDNLYAVYAEAPVDKEALFLFAYDDVKSIQYFGENLDAYWKKGGKTIETAMAEAAAEYATLYARCEEFSARLEKEATAAGGEEYAELLVLAYRQVMGAHKLVSGPKGEVFYISKECFSNGCAATVDVTYPSAPLYLYYNTELLKGMIRPVMQFARSDDWEYDFAPHDVGTYPLLNGQTYGPHNLSMQMPVEECGNLILLVNAICEQEGDYTFAKENLDLMEKWSRYLVEYGLDPENQLCTDDFAGHLAHNCNLGLKAIMGMVAYGRILAALERGEEAQAITAKAKEYIAAFLERAVNEDGSYRLAYDRPGTFSLKYNAIWDKLWGTKLLPTAFYDGEMARYKAEALPYGVPLDSRDTYTKSDWELWAACLAENEEDFRTLVHLLWKAYHTSHSRVPMTDWYYADVAAQKGFQNRTVQGGLWMKLLMK